MIAGKAYRVNWLKGFFVYDLLGLPSNVSGSIVLDRAWKIEGDRKAPYPNGTPVFVIESNACLRAGKIRCHRVLLPDGTVALLRSDLSEHFNEIR